MAVLNARQRRASATVVVNGQPKFPIPDKGHARAALARLNQAKPPLTPAQKARVRAKAEAVLGSAQPAVAQRKKAPAGKRRLPPSFLVHEFQKKGMRRP